MASQESHIDRPQGDKGRAALSLSLLGTYGVTLHGAPAAGIESDRVRALLAYLAVESDRPHRRQVLAALLWPDRPESRARGNLRQALYNLRRALQTTAASPSLRFTAELP